MKALDEIYRGQAQIVEKEKKHYQGLPEDLTPTAGKVEPVQQKNENRQDREVTKIE